MKRFFIHKLGCPKNDVDAEYIAGYLNQLNMSRTDNAEEADVCIVNTCGFIKEAKEESIEAIMALIGLKDKQKHNIIAVTGCMSQRYGKVLAEEIPELDGIFGLHNFTDIKNLIDDPGKKIIKKSENPVIYNEYNWERQVDETYPFAYLKISDGCDNRCAYCSIPDIRGRFRSRRMEKIIEEAEYLLNLGKKELILVSQECTSYGRDIYNEPKLIELLEKITRLSSEFWVRVMYLHPARISKNLIEYMIDNPKICNYFDLPLQHINDNILGNMGRLIKRQGIEKLLGLIRMGTETSAIRTNFIVGFPGETDEQFEELCQFIEDFEFDRLGAFAYSREDGTPAANLPDQVDEEVKQERYHRIMEIQQQIAFNKNDSNVDKKFEVLIETEKDEEGFTIARTRFDAPEIDQNVKLRSADLKTGDILQIKIIGTDGYDLLGTREGL